MNSKAIVGRPTKQASEQLGQHILDVASASFLEKGLQGASIEGIAKAAGVSKLTIYRQFSNKNTLFMAVINKYVARYIDALTAATNTNKPPRQALFDIGCFMAEQWFNHDNVKFSRMIVAEVDRVEGLSKLVDQVMNQTRTPIERYLEQLKQKGLVRFSDVRAVTIQFVQLCVSGHYYLLRDEATLPGPEARVELVRSAVDLFIHGYFLPEVAV
ncbi:TetR/AcrR family transcriptional regulator [Methylobacillus arboreus]|uniref:TetR/AcrR family transcriptional regulator n=1 Tax=Methylobacillus arboreus TaxID=755170 RepID=UPI001E569DBB|nr:TetR/AcrR family transcriptional regulator [Methylobacillus arboreus]MCB5191693.1 TetR/AcrR family transcriptional regulator [Methylobacillus arboreus]